MASIIKVDQIQESTTGVGTNFPNIVYLDDDTTANTPVLSFTGDTNTGIGRSTADTLDLITNGSSRLRIEPTGQIKAVYESTIGTDYNTTLHNGYLCRAWVNFTGIDGTISACGNVTSVTKNATGDFTINFTVAMPDSNFAVFGMAKSDDATNPRGAFMNLTAGFTATNSSFVRVNTHYENTITRGTTTTTVGVFR